MNNISKIKPLKFKFSTVFCVSLGFAANWLFKVCKHQTKRTPSTGVSQKVKKTQHKHTLVLVGEYSAGGRLTLSTDPLETV